MWTPLARLNSVQKLICRDVLNRVGYFIKNNEITKVLILTHDVM